MNKEAMTPHLVALLSRFVKPVAKTQTGQLLSRARDLYKTQGFQEALSEVAKHKSLTYNLGKMPKYFEPVVQTETGTRAGRAIRKTLGNFAEMTQQITKGVPEAGWHAPIQVSKNLLSAMAKNVRGSRYTTVDLAKATTEHIKEKGGKGYYGKYFPKKIVGSTVGSTPGKEKLILRKSPIGQIAGVATSAPALGFYAYQSHKKKSVPKGVGLGIGEATAMTISPGATFAGSTLYDYLKTKNNTKKVSGGY
jgi:hypothetical protein